MRQFARLLAVTLAAGSIVPLAGTASADAGPTPLALTSFARIVADTAHGHLFFSPGRSGSALLVTDLAGHQVASIGSLPGATGLALSPDGASLWVAEAKGDALARVDTSTLAVVQTVALPAATCPGDVAVVGSRVVYGFSCNTYGGSGSSGGLGVVDAATGTPLGTVTSGPFYQPVVAPGPAGQVYAADAGLSPADLYLYDVSGAAPTLVAARSQIGSNLRDLAPKPDGSAVLTACGSPYEHDVYSADKLASAGVYASAPYPNAAAWSADGRIVAVGSDSAYDVDVRLYAAGGSTALRAIDFGTTTETLRARGLAVSPDGSQVWAVTGDATGSSLALRQISQAAPATSAITVGTNPSTAYPSSSTTLSGQLTSGGVALAGATVTIVKTVNGAVSQLPPQTTASDGSYRISDTMPGTTGTVTYQVSYAGDATHSTATASTTVSVQRQPTSLSITAQRGTGKTKKTVFVTAHLGTTHTNRTVTITANSGSKQVTLGTGTVDGSGNLSVSYQPTATTTYTATFSGDDWYLPATASTTL